MAKSVDDRIEEIKEFWIDNDIGASDWLQEIRRQLTEAVEDARREERENLTLVIKAYQDINTAYRIGRRPKEKSLDIVGEYRGEEAAHGDGG